MRGAATLAKNLAESRDAAMLYKKLATLRTDAPLEEDLDAMKHGGVDRPALEALCAEIGDTSFLERV